MELALSGASNSVRKIKQMRIKAQHKDEQVSGEYAGFYDFCDEMGWERFTPTNADFIHLGWRVSIEHEIGENVWLPYNRIELQSSPQRIAKMKHRYTDSLRPFNKACKGCQYIDGNTCLIGDFKVKQNGGCIKFTER
jgi:hypothetical protein